VLACGGGRLGTHAHTDARACMELASYVSLGDSAPPPSPPNSPSGHPCSRTLQLITSSYPLLSYTPNSNVLSEQTPLLTLAVLLSV
jgi:hypothetical protein